MIGVTNIAKNKLPVRYSVHIDHYFTGEIGLSVEGVGSDPGPRSKDAIVSALRSVIELIEASAPSDK